MRVLLLHAKRFCFKPTKKALRSAEDVPKQEVCRENALVVFCTVERGDKDEYIQKLLDDIKIQFERVKPKSVVLYPYAHLSSDLEKPKRAAELLNLLCKALKDEFEDVVCAPFGWYKEFLIHVYGHPLAELSRSYKD